MNSVKPESLPPDDLVWKYVKPMYKDAGCAAYELRNVHKFSIKYGGEKRILSAIFMDGLKV